MKRFVLALMLLTGACLSIHAQEKQSERLENREETDRWLPWRWANFVILALGLGYVLGKNVPAFFGNRTAEIQKDITEAQQQKRVAESRTAEMEKRLSALGTEIEKFKTQARAEMEQEGARIRQETAQQIEKLQKQAEAEIDSAAKTASRELSSFAGKLALDLAEQRIRGRLNAQTEAGLIEDFTNDLAKQGSKN